jgi:hypothetical protein
VISAGGGGATAPAAAIEAADDNFRDRLA